jgi:RNA ligase
MKLKPLNIPNLEKMVAERYISRQKHPTADLYIYNYTEKAQYDKVWNNETLQCRGLILDSEYNVIARPFPKFFNLGELPVSQSRNLQKKMLAGTLDFTVTDKMDGSLGIMYWDGERHAIATRGSFVSDQAKRATEIFHEILSGWHPNGQTTEYTFLFEIIYPENRIVVDYGGEEKLVILGIIETATGEEVPYEEILEQVELGQMPFPLVERFDGINDFDEIAERPNAEGYVVHIPSQNLRFKVKFEEYKRLHRIVTGFNAKRIWEYLSEDRSMDQLLDNVPDEFYGWITETAGKLISQYRSMEALSLQRYEEAKELPDRKAQAKYIIDQAMKSDDRSAPSAVVFQMLDGKPYEKTIWKLIEPPFERPFKVEV